VKNRQTKKEPTKQPEKPTKKKIYKAKKRKK